MDQISPARLDNYEKNIRSYVERYGDSCWAIIYQADVRARLEHSERMRRQGEDDHQKATNLGMPHDYDSAKPWEYVWNALVEDQRFWRKEVEEPCLLVKAKSAAIQTMVEADAPIGRDSLALTSALETNSLAPKRRRVQERMHKIGEDGLLTHNRRGTQLCEGYQKGECKDATPDGSCKRNPAFRHQCAKCLSPMHGASQCPTSAPKLPRANHGKGRGKSAGKRK